MSLESISMKAYLTFTRGYEIFTIRKKAVRVPFIDLQKETNDIVMGTHGRGVIIIDDISPLREINEEVLSKNLHFFKNKYYK